MTLDDIKKLVTPEGVKNALEPQLFGSLTGISADAIATPRNTYQDDFDFETIEDVLESESYPTQVWPAILVTACNNAATWAYVTILKAGKIDTNCTDDQLSVMSTAITKRAIYELGRISQFDDNFYKDKTEAQNLLDAILGLTSREGDNAGAFYFGASITKDENSNSKNLNPLFKFAKRW